MKSRRNVVAAVALLAVLSAGPAAADWDRPEDGSSPVGLEDLMLATQLGLQVVQVAL